MSNKGGVGRGSPPGPGVEDGRIRMPGEERSRVRLDKWLWAARFYKTRSMASEAVGGGHVHVDGVRAKPSKLVALGDQVEVTKGEVHFCLQVTGLADRRRSAAEAVLLYRETDESRTAREAAKMQRRAHSAAAPVATGRRPTKRDRRRMDRLIGRD